LRLKKAKNTQEKKVTMRFEVYYYGSANVLAASPEEAVKSVSGRFAPDMGLSRVREQFNEFVGAMSFRDERKDPAFLQKKEELFRLHGRVPVIFHGKTIISTGSKEEAELKCRQAVEMLFKPDEQLALFIDSMEVTGQ
jgi:hypothetical protein